MKIKGKRIKDIIYTDDKRIQKNVGKYAEINIKLNVRISGRGLTILDDYNIISENENLFEVKIITRLKKSIARYWIVLKALEFHFDGFTAAEYDIYFKKKYLPVIEKRNPLTGEIELTYSHINYDDMPNEQDFIEYRKKVFAEIEQTVKISDLVEYTPYE